MSSRITVKVDHDNGADFPIKLKLEPAGSNRVRLIISEEDGSRIMHTEVGADDLVRAALVMKTATAPSHYGEL